MNVVHGETEKVFQKTLYAFAIFIVTETGKPDTQVFYALIYNYVMPYYERDWVFVENGFGIDSKIVLNISGNLRAPK